jgi:diguanylate cyclase (GGDEF)-like protein
MPERGRRSFVALGESLRTKLLAVVLLCVVAPVLGMGIYLLRRNEEILGEKVRETVSNHLFRKTTQVEEWILERHREASRWAASFIVFEGVESLTRRGADGERIRLDLRDYLESVLGHYQVYESLFIVDLKGEVVSGTREERLEDWGRAAITAGPPLRDPMLSPLRRSEYLGRPTLLILSPIQSRLETTLGYLVLRVDLRELESLLGTPPGDLAPSFWLLDDKGQILVKAGRVVERPGLEAFPGPLPPEDAEMTPASEGILAGLGPMVYGVRRLGRLEGAHLAALVPAAAAYRPLVDSRTRLLRLGIPMAVVVFALTFLAARQMLRPILLLSEGAKRVSAGDPEVRLPVSGHDEVADLTRAFNEMARRIQEGRLHLEETRDELAKSNQELVAANRRLEELAITDSLTGLFNRRHFQDTLDREMQRGEREGWSLSLLLLDLDHFKQFNDKWGHSEGDNELKRVAGQLQASVRSTDSAYRYGGEEFAMILTSCPKDQALRVAEKVREAVGALARPGRFGWRTTVSIGVATFPEDGRVARGLIDMADAALYAAKARGRDRVIAAGDVILDDTLAGE